MWAEPTPKGGTMSEPYNASADGQQWDARAGASSDIRGVVNLHDAEWFCRVVSERAEAAAKAAGIGEGQLILSRFGELSLADGSGKWKSLAPRNKPFAPNQHRLMAETAMVWAKEPGSNVYMSMALYPRGLGGNNRGKASEALGVFGLGADLDGDKGRTMRIEDLPLPPSIVISSSRDPAENFNVIYLLDHLITVEEARPLARALADVVSDADGGTADPTHVWRVPGTLNWPKKTKVARGRPLAPQPVRLQHEAMKIYGPKGLRDAFEVALEEKLRGRGITEFYSDTGPLHPNAAAEAGPARSGDHWTPDMPNAERELQRDLDALRHISADCRRNDWRKVVAAIADRHLGSDTGRRIARAWSLGGTIYGVTFFEPNGDYTADDFEACWRDASGNPHFGIGTVFHFAKEARWNSSRGRWGLGRVQRPGRPLSAEALRVQEAGLAMPRKNFNLERIAWYWQVLKTTRRPDLREVAFVIAFSINTGSGFAWRTFESIAGLLGWSRGRKGEGFRRVSTAVRDLALSGFIVRSPGNERGAHGKMGPSFALTLPNAMTWDACVSEYLAEFSNPIVGAQQKLKLATTDTVLNRSAPTEEVRTLITGERNEPKLNASDPHQGSPVENTHHVDHHQGSAVHLNVEPVAGGEGATPGSPATAAPATDPRPPGADAGTSGRTSIPQHAEAQATADNIVAADGWTLKGFWGPASGGAHG
jgi:hypothetical protein